MGGIFISYRREDSRLYAGRLRDTLSNHFGAEQVFRDIDTMNPGERFTRRIEEAVGSCDALLALHRAHVADNHRRGGPAPAGQPRRPKCSIQDGVAIGCNAAT